MDAMDAAPRSRFRWMREIDWDDAGLTLLLIAAFIVAPILAVLNVISGGTLGLVMVGLVGLAMWQFA